MVSVNSAGVPPLGLNPLFPSYGVSVHVADAFTPGDGMLCRIFRGSHYFGRRFFAGQYVFAPWLGFVFVRLSVLFREWAVVSSFWE